MTAVRFFEFGADVSNETILRMELIRARHMMALIIEKLGPDGVVKLFAKDIEENAAIAKDWARKSQGHFVPSTAEAHVAEGNAAEFTKWYFSGLGGPQLPAMLRAHPEHLRAKVSGDSTVTILEVPGHTTTPHDMTILPLQEWSEPSIKLDPDMPHRLMGRVETPDGVAFGYMLHQFRDTNPGFDAKLQIIWPSSTPEHLVRGHSDHLKIEFNNWFALYLLSNKQQPADLMPLALSVNVDKPPAEPR